MNRWLEPRLTPLVIGHRGARGLAPENTLRSIDLALDLGCDGIEIDVHLTRDDVVIVHHDDTFVRCTDVAAHFGERAAQAVRTFLAAEIEHLDASSWFERAVGHDPTIHVAPPSDSEADPNTRFAPPPLAPPEHHRVPTLKAVLELVRRRGALIDIELKALPLRDRGHLLERVIEEVRSAGMERATLLTSFDHTLVARARVEAPEMAAGILCLDRLHEVVRYARDLVGATHYLPCSIGESDQMGVDARVREREVYPRWEAIRAAGLKVIPWVVDDEGISAELATRVDGIVTDFPGRSLAARAREV